MQTKKCISVAVILLLLVNAVLLTAVIFGFLPELKEQILTRVIPTELTDLTNEKREEAALNALAANPLLTLAAQAKASDMAANGYFAHTSPDGKTPWHWLKQAGYNYLYAGENLAVRFANSDSVVNAWMNSERHRDNILGRDYTEMGIATAEGLYKGKEATFVVQMFGTPIPKLGSVLPGVSDAGGKVSAVAQVAGDGGNKDLYLEFQKDVPPVWATAMKIVESISGF